MGVSNFRTEHVSQVHRMRSISVGSETITEENEDDQVDQGDADHHTFRIRRLQKFISSSKEVPVYEPILEEEY